MTEIASIAGLHVELKRQPDAGYQIAAQHLRDVGEYEYWLTIAPSNVAAFASALGTRVRGVAEAWKTRVQQIAREGETTWMKRHVVPCEFSSWGASSGS